jgi:hypothetical protein
MLFTPRVLAGIERLKLFKAIPKARFAMVFDPPQAIPKARYAIAFNR